MANQLYFGDNLGVLRHELKAESVDLVYLDPPFNSQRDYNLLFKSPQGAESEAQITAFKDSWRWGEQAEREFHEVLRQPNTDVAKLMQALRGFLGENDIMAYLTMMANRLLALHRVLKPTGSLYLHCDPTASHYLKILLDAVFGKLLFRAEVVWKRTSAHSGARRHGRVHDLLYFYTKTDEYAWNQLYQPFSAAYLEAFYTHVDADGRRWQRSDLTGDGVRKGDSGKPWRGIEVTAKKRHWAVPGDASERLGIVGQTTQERLDALDAAGRIHWPKAAGGVPRFKRYVEDQPGVPLLTVWDDIPPLHNMSPERLGYPTQKPLALLERIVSASSNPGDVVLDPFCGCGTAVHAAQKLGRSWIGIDITHLAISLIEKRLRDAFRDEATFEVHGTPKDLAGARDLAARDKYQFQYWAVSLVNAFPSQQKKKGPDGGVDGLKFFHDLKSPEARKIVVGVKGGALKADDVRALMAVREREKAEIAILLSLHEPTAKMRADAASAGLYESEAGQNFPRVQLLSVEGLLEGRHRAEHPDYVPNVNFKQARREKSPRGRKLFDEDGE